MRIAESDRINELARKAETAGLTGAELAERAVLRQAYSAKCAAGSPICCPH